MSPGCAFPFSSLKVKKGTVRRTHSTSKPDTHQINLPLGSFGPSLSPSLCPSLLSVRSHTGTRPPMHEKGPLASKQRDKHVNRLHPNNLSETTRSVNPLDPFGTSRPGDSRGNRDPEVTARSYTRRLVVERTGEGRGPLAGDLSPPPGSKRLSRAV